MINDEHHPYAERDEREARESRADVSGEAREVREVEAAKRQHHSTAYDEQREQREQRADEREGAHEHREQREVRADERADAHEAREHDRLRRGRRDWRAAGGAYVLIVIAAVYGFFTIGQNFDQIEILTEQRVEDLAEADRLVCEANNKQDLLLSELVSGLAGGSRTAPGESPAEFRREQKFLLKAVEDLRPVDCNALPSQRPFVPR